MFSGSRGFAFIDTLPRERSECGEGQGGGVNSLKELRQDVK
jgi:hypothetical protein